MSLKCHIGEGGKPPKLSGSRSTSSTLRRTQHLQEMHVSMLQASSPVAGFIWHKKLPCSERCDDLLTLSLPMTVQLYTETYAFKEEQGLSYFSITMRAQTGYHSNKRE